MLRFVLITASSLAIVHGAAAQRAEPRPADVAAEAAPVTACARLASIKEEVDGENTLTSIRATAECKRFQECG